MPLGCICICGSTICSTRDGFLLTRRTSALWDSMDMRTQLEGKRINIANGLMNQHLPSFWSLSAAEALEQLLSTEQGITEDDARQRRTYYGRNLLKPKKRSDTPALLLS